MQHEARSTAATDLIGILDLHAAQIAPSLPDEVHSVKQGHACSICTNLERSPERIPSRRYKNASRRTFQRPMPCIARIQTPYEACLEGWWHT